MAAVMNELFVNVKVDREERPDVDAIYMEATQAMTGQGGWPMTVVLHARRRAVLLRHVLPEGAPRRDDRLRRAVRADRRAVAATRRAELDEQADQLTEALGRSSLVRPADGLPTVAEPRRRPCGALAAASDPEWGGFGGAPKFPQADGPGAALRRPPPGATSRPGAALVTTARRHGGGRHLRPPGRRLRPLLRRRASGWSPTSRRCSTTTRCSPGSTCTAGSSPARPGSARSLDETIAYLLRDLRQPGGGFSSAEDADSEGEEGRFYVWTDAEVRDVLEADAEADAERARPGTGSTGWQLRAGTTIPNRMHARGRAARPPEVEAARAALLRAPRRPRVRPGLDDKVLTEWNALRGRRAGRGRRRRRRAGVDRGRRRDRASSCWPTCAAPTGAGCAPGRPTPGARHLAYATDHAALVDAFTRLAEATGEARWIDEARATADALLDLFWDDERGGVFTSGRDAEALIARPKDLMDNATPGANGLAAVGLLRLAALDRRRAPALATARRWSACSATWPCSTRPRSATCWPPSTSPCAARPRSSWPVTAPISLAVVRARLLPNAVLAWGERYDSPLWEGREDGQAYVCLNYTCQLPADTPEALTNQLRA